MTWLVLLISALLAAVAAFGVLRPYRRGRAVALERLTDPLADERTTLLRTLRDLDDERAAGVLSPRDHAALRSETEVRAVAVLRALEARDGDGEVAQGMRELRSPTVRSPAPAAEAAIDANGSGIARPAPAHRANRGSLAALVVGVLLAIAVVPLLIGAITKRGAGGSISGDTGIAGSARPGSTGTGRPRPGVVRAARPAGSGQCPRAARPGRTLRPGREDGARSRTVLGGPPARSEERRSPHGPGGDPVRRGSLRRCAVPGERRAGHVTARSRGALPEGDHPAEGPPASPGGGPGVRGLPRRGAVRRSSRRGAVAARRTPVSALSGLETVVVRCGPHPFHRSACGNDLPDLHRERRPEELERRQASAVVRFAQDVPSHAVRGAQR